MAIAVSSIPIAYAIDSRFRIPLASKHFHVFCWCLQTNVALISWNRPLRLPCTYIRFRIQRYRTNKQKTPWPELTSELYRLSDRCLFAKLVPTFADRGCHVVGVTDPHGRVLGFLDRRLYFLLQIAPQLYSQGWVDPVSGPLLLRNIW
jgi:hypothetical protein